METDRTKYTLFDYEKQLVEEYIRQEQKTDDEIKTFIDVLVALREHPDKNPQLRKKVNRK